MKIPLQFIALFAVVAATTGQAFAQTPAVNTGGVVNAAGLVNGQAVTPGSLVAIFGSQLAGTTALSATIPLAVALANVSVTFNGETAPLSFVSPNQINAQLPWDLLNGTNGTANVVVNNNGALSPPQPVLIGQAGPGVFAFNGHAIAVNFADSSVAAPTGSIAGINTHPAKVGDILIVYASGLGPVNPPIGNGAASTDGVTRQTVTKPIVLLGNVPAGLLFSGLSTFVGVYQLNVTVPQVPAGSAIPFQVQMGGITSSSAVTIAVQ